ncbi:hypothetical protein BO79DRAFT_45016 [Aspergillus costaricaensis CBS 115574]|uniref:Uncharacterized protein n=1 Tax=Aspergillus costaricaensis CBS 115574 TaxID=1448317 RepID=A0ACD1IRR6_9EURO|nr:hypothetical protein BO79DRAFT_45016 [Aspergillus costaricaensis CBS 115574]RAK93304.1 hypothetical protein BO79DRAFT_45016 [Aspergillus costaricaensis CBS 115574]
MALMRSPPPVALYIAYTLYLPIAPPRHPDIIPTHPPHDREDYLYPARFDDCYTTLRRKERQRNERKEMENVTIPIYLFTPATTTTLATTVS